MTFYKTVKNCITLMLALLILISCSAFKLAYAEEGGIMKELASMSIDGKPFNVSDYPAVADGAPQLLNLYEGGYSQSGEQERYGLLLYIYNPSQIELKDDNRNAVQMITGNAEAERSAKYSLKLLEVSSDKLFAKFRVDFTEQQKAYVLSTLDKNSRRYDVNTVELYISGANAQSFPIERAFTYSGYESTDSLSGALNYTEEGGTETEPIKLKHTSWRPDGSKPGAGKYVQESLHSVYFAIPNDIEAQYDYLKSVHVDWLEALTAPIFVTGNAEVYKAVRNLIDYQALINPDPYGSAPTEFDFNGFEYSFLGGAERISEPLNKFRPVEVFFGANYDLISKQYFGNVSGTGNKIKPNKLLNGLYWYFFAGSIKNNELVNGNAGDYTVSSKELLYHAENFRPFDNDRKVAGKYPSYLFESWADEKYEDVIEVGKEYTLKSEKVRQSWWEKLWHKNHVEDEKLKTVKAIQEVESITGNSEVDCAAYYIGESDYPEFSAFYDANKDNSTIYLLRFATSDYTQMQTFEIRTEYGYSPKIIDQNAYFAQTKAFLDFDVIDLEYVKENKSYIIPVDMSPIDIFPNITPPVYWDEPVSDFWKYGCAMIAGLIAVYVVYRVAIKIRRGKQ